MHSNPSQRRKSLLRQINVRELIKVKHTQMKKALITRSDSTTTQLLPRRKASILYAAVVSAALTISFATSALAAAPNLNSNGNASGFVGILFSYQITANETIPSGGYSTTVSIPGVGFNSSTGQFSGTPTTLGTFSGKITVTNVNGVGNLTLTVTINPPTHTAPTASFTMS